MSSSHYPDEQFTTLAGAPSIYHAWLRHRQAGNQRRVSPRASIIARTWQFQMLRILEDGRRSLGRMEKTRDGSARAIHQAQPLFHRSSGVQGSLAPSARPYSRGHLIKEMSISPTNRRKQKAFILYILVADVCLKSLSG